MRERRRDYELMFVISPLHTNDEEIEAIINRLAQSIQAAEGIVTSIDHTPPWGRRKFAYAIREYAGGEASRRTFNEGYYVLMNFSLSAARMGEVERTLRFTDQVLRHLIILVDAKPKPAMDAADATEDAVADLPNDTAVDDTSNSNGSAVVEADADDAVAEDVAVVEESA